MNPAQFFKRCQSYAALHPNLSWMVATVLSTLGSTPRKSGAQMALAFDGKQRVHSIGSIGGGAGEARMLRLAEQMMERGQAHAQLRIDLRGQPDAGTEHDGVCGGSMHVELCRISDTALFARVAARLQRGEAMCFEANCLDAQAASECSEANDRTIRLTPWPRVLVSGAGHCGQALMSLLEFVGFDVALHDQRGTDCMPDDCIHAPSVHTDAQALDYLAATKGPVWWLLLSRNLHVDVQALSGLATHRARQHLQYLGVMGSSKRLRHLHDALPWLRDAKAAGMRADFRLVAPIGLDTGEAPEAIAVGITAQLLQWLSTQQKTD